MKPVQLAMKIDEKLWEASNELHQLLLAIESTRYFPGDSEELERLKNLYTAEIDKLIKQLKQVGY